MEPTVFSSGFIVFQRSNDRLQFLLMQHRNRWDLPKGHLDPGETREVAALRELSEETGIQRDDIWIDPEFEYRDQYMVSYQRTSGPQLKELTIYLACLLRPVAIQATEHLGFQWFDWRPPHAIQAMAIDPLLARVEAHLASRPDWPGLQR